MRHIVKKNGSGTLLRRRKPFAALRPVIRRAMGKLEKKQYMNVRCAPACSGHSGDVISWTPLPNNPEAEY